MILRVRQRVLLEEGLAESRCERYKGREWRILFQINYTSLCFLNGGGVENVLYGFCGWGIRNVVAGTALFGGWEGS